jgi:hypothetical protein
MKSRITTEKATFNRKKTLFTSKSDLNLRRKLVKGYIRSVAFYGAEESSRRRGISYIQ